MEKEKKKKTSNLDDLEKKSSILVYGDDGTLSKEDLQLKSVIDNTIASTIEKFGSRTNGKVINYFNEINFSNTFSELFKKNKDEKGEGSIDSAEKFKRFMSEENVADINSMILSDAGRLALFQNYEAIFKHIPECAQALETYKDNILSPDDYTKLIFNLIYDVADEDEKERVEKKLEDISDKYKLEEKADGIIEKSLLFGEQYVAIISLEDGLNYMLNDPSMKSFSNLLNEERTLAALDPECYDLKLTRDDIDLEESDISVLKEIFSCNSESLNKILKESQTFKRKNLTEADIIREDIANLINENFIISSKTEMLSERLQAENDKIEKEFQNSLKDLETKRKNHKKSGNSDQPLGISGSVIRILEPKKVLDLRIDDISYGYYYVEDGGNSIANMRYLGQQTGREASNNVSFAANNTLSNTGANIYNPAQGSPANLLNVSEEKLRLISNIFINSLAKKIDKDYIRKNKKFKEFIYELIKQNYIIRRPIKVTYFLPEEVVKFEVPAVFRKILFFAKLYLSLLSNDLLIKLGRSHDKRVFYVSSGLDADYEQAISTVIQDIKTKEYKMDNMNDINTILNLNPGRFDDYFIPTIGGEKPIEIDTLQGMDANSDNDFLEYLRNSMLSGIGVPKSLIDALTEVDFARTLSAQNAVFLRSVIKYQKKFSPSFSKMLQILYENENKFIPDLKDEESSVIIQKIKVKFPSPASLNFSNLSEQIQSVDSNAEFISNQLVTPSIIENRDDERNKLKAKIVKDMLPGVDWDLYEGFLEEMKIESNETDLKTAIKNKNKKPEDSFSNPIDMQGF